VIIATSVKVLNIKVTCNYNICQDGISRLFSMKFQIHMLLSVYNICHLELNRMENLTPVKKLN
jgi:hypothetical protein